MCTVKVAPASMLIGWPARDSDWVPAAPLRPKALGLPVVVSIDHVTGLPALPPGRPSVNTTPVAVPAPVLVIVTVNPIGVPADTLAASAVLVILIWAHNTVSDAPA